MSELDINNIKKYIDYELSLQDLKNKCIVLFGAGPYGEMVKQYLSDKGIEIFCYCDNDDNKHGKCIDNKKIISPEEIINLENYIVFITARHCSNQIRRQLEKMDIMSYSFDNFIVKSRYDEFKDIHDNILNDYKTKEVYISILTSMVTGESKYCEEIMEGNSFYALPKFSNTGNEVFVDAGAYVGDTVEQFIWNNIGQFKKIYAFEPGHKQFNAMKLRINRLISEWALNEDKINCIQAGLGSKSEESLYFENDEMPLCNNIYNKGINSKVKKIQIYSLDDYIKHEKVTFIKSDIEGFELELLKGSKRIISLYKPKLAISIYHKPDDLIEIIKYLKCLVPEYKFDLRHHAPTLVDTVLYCWI